MKALLPLLILLAACLPMPLRADLAADWAQIVALDAGPKAEVNSAEQFKIATLQHLERQENALRKFIVQYPEDTHTFSAYLRLAHLLAIRSDLKANEHDWAEAIKVLDELESRTAPDSLSDVAFARISLSMIRLKPGNSKAIEEVLQKIREFQQAYPQDRRNGRLLVEIATLFDDQPARKESLLQQARLVAVDVEIKKRVEDDLKRVALVDKPLELQFTPVQGKAVDLNEYRGKVVFVVFFAQWSPPSLKAIEGLQAALKRLPQARALGISLDQDPGKLAAFAKSRGLDWPIACDGKGWGSPLARNYGINSLPTIWLVDRNGVLRRLNVRSDWEDAVRQSRN